MKVRGGVLYYTLLVLILSSSVLGMVFLASYYDNRHLYNLIKIDELDRDIHSAINLFAGGDSAFNNNDNLTVKSFAKNGNKVFVRVKKWGNYQVVISKSEWKNSRSQKVALLGSENTQEEQVALFLSDEGRPLSISGNTILKGKCYLPDKKIIAGAIEGQQYLHKQMVSGEVFGSSKLPEINKSLLAFAESYINDLKFDSDSIINLLDLESNQIENSFSNKTLIVLNDTLNSLENLCIKGNVIFWSIKPIEVDSTVDIVDAIFFAPRISFKKGFEGELQAFALQSITLENNCHLKFPSQVCIIQGEKSKYLPSDSLCIRIKKSALLEGGAIIKSNGLFSYLSIEENSAVSGQIYCPGYVELKGCVSGSLYCRNFILGTSRARYYNHLLNAKIDYSSLSKHFVGVSLLKENKVKSLIKWLS